MSNASQLNHCAAASCLLSAAPIREVTLMARSVHDVSFDILKPLAGTLLQLQ
jgi:hypothetical protein